MTVRHIGSTLAVLAATLSGGGCALRDRHQPAVGPAPAPLPRELNKVTMPDYTIEPPDVLIINATRLVPRPPYVLEPLDTVVIQAKGAIKVEPIDGEFTVEPDGRVNLGRSYGAVQLAGLNVDQAKAAVEKQLRAFGLTDPTVYLAPARTRPLQPIVGEHLVRPDGQVSLGTYGLVRVVGLTAAQAQQAIQAHLSRTLLDPVVSVDVAGFNSKVYYVVFDGGGVGQQVYRLPATGNETVLDAVAQVNGLTPVSSSERMWVARPGPAGTPCQTLPVDWAAISLGAATDTNYQLFPGDRLYVQAKPLVALDNAIARIIAPAERLFGFTLLGSGVVSTLQAFPVQGNAFGGGFGGVGGFGVAP